MKIPALFTVNVYNHNPGQIAKFSLAIGYSYEGCQFNYRSDTYTFEGLGINEANSVMQSFKLSLISFNLEIISELDIYKILSLANYENTFQQVTCLLELHMHEAQVAT